eukprot:c5280_g1_i1.p1 GENE.c5280_g1_i1~~c5280_g1_i1.p1  ORF type:complete len:518 (-),score=102.46 c5280_g1_i1:85-1638(-)
MQARLIVLGFCAAVAFAVQSHGPAHVETEQHARNSQSLAENLYHMQKRHTEEITAHIQHLASKTRQQHLDDMASGTVHELRRTRQRLDTIYNRSPAISLLEKISFSKKIQPEAEDDKNFMRGLFGFDEKKLQEELEKLQKADPDIVESTRDEVGFSEDAFKAVIEEESKKIQSAPAIKQAAQAQDIEQLLQTEEGATAQPSRRMIDWKKWDSFMLNEFEAARITGELDATAHKVPAAIIPSTSRSSAEGLTENIQLNEGTDKGMTVDKLCGCEVTLSHPVCGSDGETYPSDCFARCAGLAVSHSGPCLSKGTVSAPGSFKTMTENLGSEQLLSLGVDTLSSSEPAPVFQEAGVDFPSFPSHDATVDAAEALTQSTQPHKVELPFSHVVTKRQFEEDMKELGHIADEFAPALNDERMAKCDCRGAYSPVCGRDFKTYPSPCYASCMGVELMHVGVCSDRPHLGQAPHTMEEVRDPLCFCSFKQKHVCGVNGKTYVNRCFADCEGMKIRSGGPCLGVQA